MSTCNVFSFDIYDTCLVRSCGESTNIFYLLAQEVMGPKADFISQRDFVRMRHNSEEIAMMHFKKEYVTLDEIYEVFDPSYYTSLPKESIKKIELKLEEESLEPVKAIKQKIEECRKRGKVIFISDMYLPSTLIRNALTKYDLIRPEESVYISADYNASKKSGNLFDIVQKKESIKKKYWTHFGDNPISDILIPQKKGIKAIQVINDYTKYEQICLREALYSESKIPISIFAGAMRAARLSSDTSTNDIFHTNISSGLLVPFVINCLKDAQLKGIKKLYFASRDAFIMLEEAKYLHDLFPEIELQYLHISTKVVYPLLIKEGTREELLKIITYIAVFKPKSILSLLGLNDEDIQNIGKNFDIESEINYKSDKIESFISEILKNGRKQKIVDFCNKKNGLTKEYLRQEGFIDSINSGKIGLVDIGWKCTTQLTLSQALKNQCFYYYLGLVDENYYEAEMGKYHSDFFIYPVKAYRQLIEAYICKNTEKTLIGYKKSNGIVIPLQSQEISSSDKDELEDYLQKQKALKNLTHNIIKYPIVINASTEIFREYSLRMISDISNNPSKAFVNFLKNKLFWEHYSEKSPLIVNISNYFFLKIKNKVLKKRIKHHDIWKQASYVYTFGNIGHYLLSMKQKLKSMFKNRPYKTISTLD